MKNRNGLDTRKNLQILVTTDEPSPVSFTVTTMNETRTMIATYGSVTKVELLAVTHQIMNDSERDKGILVQAEVGKTISAYGVNDQEFSTDGFLALSCDGMTVRTESAPFRRYEYIIFSGENGASNPIKSEFLIVPCESDTHIDITPTQNITFNFGMGSVQIFAEKTKNVTLQAGKTYLISHRNDLTGTIVRSDKPISLFAGHECAQFPATHTACDHLVEQIPPHTTWGTTYFLSPLAGRESGDVYRVATTYDHNQITVTCIDEGNSTTETVLSTSLDRGSWKEFNVTYFQPSCPKFVPKYCCVEATKPVIIAQYSQGYTVDTRCTENLIAQLGDPFMILVPPVTQYSNNYTFSTFKGISGGFLARYINIAVHEMFFQPDMIFMDGQLVEADRNRWNPFYCSIGVICGYGLSKSITTGDHTIYHRMESAALGVTLYGFQEQNSYGFLLGMKLQPISGILFVFCALFTLFFG